MGVDAEEGGCRMHISAYFFETFNKCIIIFLDAFYAIKKKARDNLYSALEGLNSLFEYIYIYDNYSASYFA